MGRLCAWLAVMTLIPGTAVGQTALIWEPTEWTFSNPTFAGNPFDLIASATFTHVASGDKITTQLYYEGTGADWTLRFTGTRLGQWTFITTSTDPELNGLTGSVDVQPNPGAAGFLTQYAGGNRWGRLGLDEAFVPQYVMYVSPLQIHQNPGRMDADLGNYFGDHGFNGLHTMVFCGWFDITKETYDQIPSSDPNPDPRTFVALEYMIDKARAAGGLVHIWAWGDEQRHMTPNKWGKNGTVDQRLQRYICARLGPLPNWTMGYGFDLQEWVNTNDLQQWHAYMHQHLGWPHYLGARSPDMTQIYSGLDYASYQQWRPTYDTYVQGIETLFPGRPKLFEDRFRVRENVYPEKDYTIEMTRRGLYHSTMAGGAANIWGYLIAPAPADGSSGVYPNRTELLTASRVFRDRFKKEMVRQNSITDGVCLATPGSYYVFYKENTASISMNLAGLNAPAQAVAVDARDDYEELPLGLYNPGPHTFNAPRTSDWVVAVGDPEPVPPIGIDLGWIDAESGLYRVPNGDGNTQVVEQSGRICRRNVNPSSDFYMYFNVVGRYAYAGSRPEVYITIEFHDSGTGTLTLQYDGAAGPYSDGGQVALAGTGTWRQHTFHVMDAYFGNRQNNGADFRIVATSGNSLYLNLVELTHLPPGPPPPPLNPVPANGATGVDRNVLLSWDGPLATSFDVYFGPAGAPTFRGTQPGASYLAGPLAWSTTYEWRVDARNEFGLTPGSVWSFTTGTVPVDFDHDGDVDQADFGVFQACVSGEGRAYPAGCGPADADHDGDVDPADFTDFQACLSGPNRPPGC